MLYDTILLLTIVSAIVIGVWLLRAAQRSPPPASIICIDTSSFCLNPQNVEERKSHERKQHISRGVSRQQDEPANDSMECPARSGATREAKRGDSRLEGVGRKTSIRNRRHGRTARQDQKSLATRHRRYKQRDGCLHGRSRGSHEAAAELF